MTTDLDSAPQAGKKERPELKTREYMELERTLERMEDPQKIVYLKKRLTNHICSVYIEEHPELGLITDDDPRMVSELQRRIHRINKILDDSPIYSPFLRGIKIDRYKDTGWSTRPSLAKRYLNDIQILAKQIDGVSVQERTTIPEIEISDMIYDSERGKKGALVPEVHILRGLHNLAKIQRMVSTRYASDKDLSKLRANHGNYRNALRHIASGIYNGGLSLFSVVAFGRVFDRYIQNYRLWLSIELLAIRFSGRLEVIQLQRKVDRHIETLKNLRKNNKNITLLRRMYNWFPDDFRYQRIRISEVKSAFKNKDKGNDSKRVKGIVSRQLIAVFLNLVLFLAGSPLARLSLLLSDNIVSVDPELTLRKRQIYSTQMLNNFYKVFGLEGDSQKGPVNALKLLDNIVEYCEVTIKRYLPKAGSTALEKPYERDPFIKIFTGLRMFLTLFPQDKTARALLHNFYPHAQQLLKGSMKKDHISVAHTIVTVIENSISEHKSERPSRRSRVARAG